MPRLTAISIENAKPRTQRYALRDDGCRGLYLNVLPSGRKSWSVRYRFDGRTRNLTLDGFPTLALARKAATNALAEVAQGHDPAAAKQAQKRTDATIRHPGTNTVEHWVGTFIERHVRRATRLNTQRQVEHVLENIVLPEWRSRPVTEIKRKDVRELVESVAQTRPVMANRVLAIVGKFFNWLLERDIIEVSPTAGIKRPVKEQARDRVLSDEELRRVWLAADAVGGASGAVVKVLMLSGLRRNEVANLRWDEIADGTLKLSAERMMGGKPHVLPMSTQVATIIDAMPKIGSFVFGGRAPLWHFGRTKRALDAHIGDIPAWVMHDLRRSVASGMARIGILLPVIERVLAHESGSFAGIVGVYQRHSYAAEMALALRKWGDHIERLVTGAAAKVVKLR